MKFSRKAAGLVAVGGVAALGVGLLVPGGIGAVFTSQSSVTAKIGVGTFGCQIQQADSANPNSALTISSDGHTATVDFGTITSSAASERSALIRVANTGSIPAIATWTVTPGGNLTGDIMHYDPVTIPLGATDSEMMKVGFHWNELQTGDLGRSGSVVYHLTCVEAQTIGQDWLLAKDGSGAALPISDTNYFATWSGSTTGSNISLHVANTDPNALQATVVKLLDVAQGSAVPAHEPTFTSTDGAVGSLRLDVKLSDGSYNVRYAEGTNIGNWAGYANWNALVANAQAKHLTVTKVFLIMDGPELSNNTINCINYSGTPLFGTC